MHSDHQNGNDPLYHLRMISKKELLKLIPYSDQHLLRLEKAGKFPRRIALGQNRVSWFVWQIEAWQRSRTTLPVPAISTRGNPDDEGSGGAPLAPLPQLRGGGATMSISSKRTAP
jgi:prophage regulatory protein